MHTTDAALDQAPEALNGVRVHVTHDIHFAGVMDAMVTIACASYPAVAQEFVGEDGALRHHVLFDGGQERCGRRVRRDPGDDLALTLAQAHDHGLTRRAPSALATAPATEVTFVCFDLSCQEADAFIHQEPYLLEHPPCRLVGDAEFPFQLLCRDAAPCGCHQEHGMEPGLQFSGGLVEDRSGQGVDVVAAVVTGVGRAFVQPVVGRYPLAIGARDTVGPAGSLQVLQTRRVGRELPVELVDGVPFHGSSLPGAVRVVKG